MLVLTRKVGEKIRVGDDIVVTLLEIKGNRVRLGVEAPLTVPVLRSELMEKDLEALQVAEVSVP